MTLTELQAQVERMIEHANLQNLDPSCVDVTIKRTTAGSIGGTPGTDIAHIQMGIDWDHGRCIIYPKQTLVVINEEDLKSWRKSIDTVGWDYYRKMAK